MFKTSQSYCHYFNTESGCKFGTNCNFLHVNIPSSQVPNKYKDGTVKSDPESRPTPQPATLNSYLPDQSHEATVRNTLAYQSHSSEASSHISSEDVEENDVKTKRCFQHFKHGNCRFGNRCKFSHSDDLRKSVHDDREEKKNTQKVKTPLPELTTDDIASVDKHEGSKSGKKAKTPVTCRYFIAGRCRSGNRCRFYHPRGNEKLGGISAYKTPQEDNEVSKQTGPKETSGKSESAPSKNPKVTVATRPAFRPPVLKREISRDKVGKDVIKKLQTTEISQLKKRFPTDSLKIIKETEDEENIYCLSFKPTDPDWPFDVDVYDIQLTFPPSYPVKMFKAEVPTDQNLPETLRSYVEASISEWLNQKETELENRGVLELTFRPFIHWLDKEMEDIVTEGLKQLQRELMAKAAGFEFIPASVLRERLRGRNSGGSDEEEVTDSDEENDSEEEEEEMKQVAYRKKDEEQVYTGPEEYSSDEDETDDLNVVTAKFEEANLNSERKGTEIRLRNLVMKETVSTMTYTQIKIVVQCSRCKSNTDLLTPVGRVNLIPCFKCHTQMLLTFRPAIMHSYSSIMGYLDLEGCVPFDLLLQDSAYKLGCMNCNKETKVDSLYPGQPMDTWCKSCHQKLRVTAEDAKFTVLLPTEVETEKKEVHEVSVKKMKRIVKDPVIKFGNPLPDNGTCKHYKKSFRWFRFPCCGKCYPCDLCHEEGEDGHEMVLANRMICGFCCREQPFALERPCLSCGHSMTKSTTSHWEGGMGCRDKIRMSKNDSQKYANMNKTTSRKAMEKKQPNKKKNTKLRHSSN